MNKILAAKLKLSEQQNVLIKNLPETLIDDFEGLSTKAVRGKKYEAAILFATTQAELCKRVAGTLTALQHDAIFWIGYPKKSGAIKTDTSRDSGWDALKEAGYIPVSLIAIDQTWSALRFRKAESVPRITRQDKTSTLKNVAKKAERILEIPAELETLLVHNTKAKTFFETLSYTNRKEYIVWITSAVKPETRLKRLSETIEKLTQGLKNPSAK